MPHPLERVFLQNKKNQEIEYFWGKLKSVTPQYTMEHSKFIVSNQKEGYISKWRIKANK